jgi:SRP72 RNA-binding domain
MERNQKRNLLILQPTPPYRHRADFDVHTPAQYQTTDEQYFWECRATVLLAHCLVAIATPTSNSAAMQPVVSNSNTTATSSDASADSTSGTTPITDHAAIQNAVSSVVAMLDPFCSWTTTAIGAGGTGTPNYSAEVQNHVLLYSRLHQTALQSKWRDNQASINAINNDKEELQTLESLPDTIRSKPVVQATIAQHQRNLRLERGMVDGSSNSNKSTDIGSTMNERMNALNNDETPTLLALDEIVKSLQQKISSDGTFINVQKYIVYADFAMSRYRYKDATVLYEAVMDIAGTGIVTNQKGKNAVALDTSDANRVLANYICALSHVRPEDAITTWSKVQLLKDRGNEMVVPDLMPIVDDNGTSISGMELEMKEIVFYNKAPALQQQQQPDPSHSSTISNRDATTPYTKTKSHDAVLRQRAKRREVYLQSLPSHKATNVPDPERWLPKYERSNYSKYRRRRIKGNNNDAGVEQYHKGAQGTVSIQEMAKLDVVAHQNMRAAMNDESTNGKAHLGARSTAHMNVSGKGKKRR